MFKLLTYIMLLATTSNLILLEKLIYFRASCRFFFSHSCLPTQFDLALKALKAVLGRAVGYFFNDISF